MTRAAQLLLTGSLLISAAVTARPLVIEESHRFEAPRAGLTFFGESVAIQGDWALATALLSEDGSYEYPYRQLALLYRRSGNTWLFDRVLVDDPTTENSWNLPKVAMGGTLASVSTSPLRMFRRNLEGEWLALTSPFPAAPGNDAWANGAVGVDGKAIVAIAGSCTHAVVSTDLVGRAWSSPQLISGNSRICSVPNTAAALDIDGNRMAFTSPQEDSSFPPNETRVYTRAAPATAWQLEATLPTGDYGVGLALNGNDLLIGGWDARGNEVYRRSANGSWKSAGYLPTLRGLSAAHAPAWHLSADGDLVAASTFAFDGRPAGVVIYRRAPAGAYELVAELVSSEGESLGPVAEISGRTVIVGGYSSEASDVGALYFFELPENLTAPAIIQDDFEDGDAAGWTAVAGTLSVARRGPSRVLRQTGTSQTALAVIDRSRMASQSVQAELRPISFEAGDRWVGLVTRYVDASNYYYVALRSGGFLTLRRLQGGRHVTLANRALPVSAGKRFRVRLESIGSRHRVYVNDQRLVDVFDGELGAGRAGVLARGASVDFDNVIVTPSHRTPLYEAEINTGFACEEFVSHRLLRQSGNPDWDCTDYAGGYLRQASMEGVARAAIGPVTGDQAVDSRMQLEDFSNTGTSDQWIGLMTRYTDENNYYYFTLRSSKGMSLRKLVDGQIVELGSAGFTLGISDWHVFRLEAIGDRIRAYIDGQLVIEAVDRSHPKGISGIATFRATALFDYLRVTQP